MKNDFVEVALTKTEHPEILINVVSQRVRQLGQGMRPLVEVSPKMTFMDVALKEVAEEKLSYESLPEDSTEENE